MSEAAAGEAACTCKEGFRRLDAAGVAMGVAIGVAMGVAMGVAERLDAADVDQGCFIAVAVPDGEEEELLVVVVERVRWLAEGFRV